MSAALRRAVSTSLASLDPELREAAERVARRAGIGLDALIVAKLDEEAAREAGARPGGARGEADAFEAEGGGRQADRTAHDDAESVDDALLRSLKLRLRDVQAQLSQGKAGPRPNGSEDTMPQRLSVPREGPDAGIRASADPAAPVAWLSERLEAVVRDHAAALARAVGQLPAPPPDVTERLERIDDRLRRAEEDDRLQPMEAALRAVAERLGDDGAASAPCPPLRQAVAELLARVDALGERSLAAARPEAGAPAGIEDALRAVHRTLESVVARLPAAAGVADAEAADPSGRGRVAEPSPEPPGGPRAGAATSEASVGDVKASFIAAARRAARGPADNPGDAPARTAAVAGRPPQADGPARIAAARLRFALGRYRGSVS